VPGKTVAAACRNLSKTYGEGAASTVALRQVALDVRFGELLMLVGPSGSGKTSLISIIAGILDQDDGECLVLGRNVRAMGPAERAEFRGESIGFVFQAFNLLPTLTIAENVALPLLIQGRPRRQALERARQGLAEVGLEGRTDALPSRLSGGQQQRVAVARALVHDPKLIVCDEPTSNLDHATGLQVMELLRNVARGPDRALIVVTHDPRIFDFADRIAHMEDGQILHVIDQPSPGERQ
jgi:putative ABC transport system ATP-binding protein